MQQNKVVKQGKPKSPFRAAAFFWPPGAILAEVLRCRLLRLGRPFNKSRSGRKH
jgi:hypothetical protein